MLSNNGSKCPPVLDWCKRGGSRGWVTIQEVLWRVGGKFSPLEITVPIGFEFESSVPRGLRWIVSQNDPHFILSACVHDYLLEVSHFEVLACAAEWHAAAKKSKAPAWKRVPMYVGVALYTLRSERYTQA